MKNINILLTALFMGIQSLSLVAQDKKVEFNGVGRAFITRSSFTGNLADLDSTTADRETKGHTLIDLRTDIFPNDVTEINATLRFGNSLDGFWTGGSIVQLRQLYVRGIAAEKVRYQIGDIYLEQTPYTLYNTDAEGATRYEPAVFNDYRQYIDYENFYVDNMWRLQGGQADIALKGTKGIDEVKIGAFGTMNRGSLLYGNLTRVFTGGEIDIKQSENLSFGLNAVSLFDLQDTDLDSMGYTNNVYSLDLDYNREIANLKFGLSGESGFSNSFYENDPNAPQDLNDYFLDYGVSAEMTNGLKAEVRYRNVGPGFRSAGAQTKRVNFFGTPENFGIVAPNDVSAVRPVGLMDINRDTTVYNRHISSDLSPYYLIYTLLEPYGAATQNRQGITLNLDYAPEDNPFEAYASAKLLTEVVGQGTEDLRSFIGVEGGVKVQLDEILDWKKKFDVSAAAYYQASSRDGDTTQAVDFNTTLIDAGLRLEVAKNLDLLLGSKMLFYSGTEFGPFYDQYNQLTNFSKVDDLDESQVMNAVGLKYNFKENIFLSVHGQFWSYTDNKNSDNSYNINQLVIFYNMNF